MQGYTELFLCYNPFIVFAALLSCIWLQFSLVRPNTIPIPSICTWVSVSEPHTSVFNVDFCLYGTHIHLTIYRGWHGWLSWSLSGTNRWRGKEWPLRLRTKERHIELPMCCYLTHTHPTMF